MNLAASLPESLRKGVSFTCTRCGACCTGAPGRVRVTETELREAARWLGRAFGKLLETAVRSGEAGGFLLRESPNGDCVFFEENRCSIHPVKPGQCRRYPFWFRNVRSGDAWRRTVDECPGIGQGTYYAPEEIVRQVHEDLEA